MWLALMMGVQVMFWLPERCGDYSGNFIGCSGYHDGHIHVKPGMTMMGTEHVVFHELHHQLFSNSTEKEAENFAKSYTGGYVLKYGDVYPESIKYININLNK